MLVFTDNQQVTRVLFGVIDQAVRDMVGFD